MTRLMLATLTLLFTAGLAAAQESRPPAVGDEATDFTLEAVDKSKVTLSERTEQHDVVILVLRGWPGYQCPICSRQVGSFVAKADEFAAAGAEVLLIYPGPAQNLRERAKEFLPEEGLPKNITMLLDGDYQFTNAWNLRWDEPRETAYPATFVIGTDRRVKFADVSKTHGGRTQPDEVLEVLE